MTKKSSSSITFTAGMRRLVFPLSFHPLNYHNGLPNRFWVGFHGAFDVLCLLPTFLREHSEGESEKEALSEVPVAPSELEDYVQANKNLPKLKTFSKSKIMTEENRAAQQKAQRLMLYVRKLRKDWVEYVTQKDGTNPLSAFSVELQAKLKKSWLTLRSSKMHRNVFLAISNRPQKEVHAGEEGPCTGEGDAKVQGVGPFGRRRKSLVPGTVRTVGKGRRGDGRVEEGC
jgi:hypothetical protein